MRLIQRFLVYTVPCISAFFLIQCEKKKEPKPDLEIPKLEKQLESYQKLGTQLEKDIANVEGDMALKPKLQEDKKLNESRIERLMHELTRRRPKPPEGEGGGHGGGGEHGGGGGGHH